MEHEESGTELPGAFAWRSTLFLGVMTLALGLIVSFHPSGSLNVIAILLGIWFAVMGLFEIASGFILRHAISKARTTMVKPPPGPVREQQRPYNEAAGQP
jgi:xanthine/uracil permease